MDYDKSSLAAGYDRARSRSPEVLALWMDAVAEDALSHLPFNEILDLGCGTGRFTQPLHVRFGARVIGMDPSKAMLRQAHRKWISTATQYVLAQGERIPLRDESVDLIFMSMVYHHFADPFCVARECYRVLRRGGSAFLRAGTAERISTYPITPFFPAAVPVLTRILAPIIHIVGTFERAGFRAATVGAIEQEIAPSHTEYAEQLQAGGDSVLARLEPAQLAEGLRTLRAHAASVDPAPVTELIDFMSLKKSA